MSKDNQDHPAWVLLLTAALLFGALVAFLSFAFVINQQGWKANELRWARGKPSVGQSLPSSPTPPPTVSSYQFALKMLDNYFEPREIALKASDAAVRIENAGRAIHNFRLVGQDGKYNTKDDIASGIIQPNQQEVVNINLSRPGIYAFRCDFHPEMMGTINIQRSINRRRPPLWEAAF